MNDQQAKKNSGCRKGCGCLIIVIIVIFLGILGLAFLVYREVKNNLSPYIEPSPRVSIVKQLDEDAAERLKHKIAKISGQLAGSSCWAFPEEEQLTPLQPTLQDLNNPELVAMNSEEVTSLINQLLMDSYFPTTIEITLEGNRAKIAGSLLTFGQYVNFTSEAQIFFTDGQWYFIPDNLFLANEDLMKKKEMQEQNPIESIMQKMHFNADIRARMSHFCPKQVFVDEGMLYFDLREANADRGKDIHVKSSDPGTVPD
ncbi:MAG: hypothetical protein PHC51_04070 [bacterium]|nr:hypothetical protein [bacterium]